jgi:hypothetical protein
MKHTPEQLHELLKDVNNNDLMYYIHSMRTDICVIQWYSPEHIKEITGTNVSIETIKENWEQIQDYLTCEWMMNTCNDHLLEMSDHGEDWGLEELFPEEE